MCPLKTNYLTLTSTNFVENVCEIEPYYCKIYPKLRMQIGNSVKKLGVKLKNVLKGVLIVVQNSIFWTLINADSKIVEHF